MRLDFGVLCILLHWCCECEQVRDEYVVPSLASARRVVVGLYDARTGQRLPTMTSESVEVNFKVGK
jgi:hypothetical protein